MQWRNYYSKQRMLRRACAKAHFHNPSLFTDAHKYGVPFYYTDPKWKLYTLFLVSIRRCKSYACLSRFRRGQRLCSFYSNPRSIQAPTPEKRVSYVARAEESVVHRQL